MKFQVAKDKLEKAMARIETIVPTRDTQTLLSNVLLDIEDDRLRITASDMESTVRISLEATDTEKGEIIVRARKLSEISKQLRANEIIFSAEKEDDASGEREAAFQVKLQGKAAGAARFKMSGNDRSHFPGLVPLPDVQLSDIPAGVLNEMINKTIYSISQEDNRYIFNGLCFISENSRLTVVGTDGRRLSAITRDLPGPLALGGPDSGDIVVHAKAIRELKSILDFADEVKTGVEQRNIFFKVGDAELSSRLLEGKFPDYKKVFPQESRIHFDIQKDVLFEALKQVKVMAEAPSYQVRLSMNTQSVKLSANTPDIGEAEVELPVSHSGVALEIGFNATYLEDIVRSLDCSQVRLEFIDASKPIVIRDIEDKDFIALVMPMKI